MIPFLIASVIILPNPTLTPGDIDKTATVSKICTSGYTKQVRDVTDSKKLQVFNAYKIDPKSDRFEVDHLISLELGGSNDVKNLWPQSYTTQPWNATVKDKLENKLHDLVCSGKIKLDDAQKAIGKNWIDTYKLYFK